VAWGFVALMLVGIIFAAVIIWLAEL
jgi:hypothetical protein